MGGEVTPLSALYSPGAMLFEMVTGRTPFLGDDSVANICQHIITLPVAPMWHSPRGLRSLNALLLRLVTKDPAGRPEPAGDPPASQEHVDPGAMWPLMERVLSRREILRA